MSPRTLLLAASSYGPGSGILVRASTRERHSCTTNGGFRHGWRKQLGTEGPLSRAVGCPAIERSLSTFELGANFCVSSGERDFGLDGRDGSHGMRTPSKCTAALTDRSVGFGKDVGRRCSSCKRQGVQTARFWGGIARRRNCRMLAIRSQRDEQKQVEAEVVKNDIIGPLTSIADFTRFRDRGGDGAELQTAIISYKKPFPWRLIDKKQVDLVAAVHIADKKYFYNLQKELAGYDRVLYEMVADKSPRNTNRNAKNRWRPPKRRTGSNGGGGFSIIGTIQRTMASILTLHFQLNCMDYRKENWYHADLDIETFQALQQERGESFFTFARDLTELSTKTIMRNLNRGEGLDPWRSRLLWVSRVFPMPLIGLFLIEYVCAPSNSPLNKSPEMTALLDFDVASALKVFLAKQIASDLTDNASSMVEKSVIIGERNRVAMSEVQEALREGCHKVAVFYGSGHLPDMNARLQRDFGLEPTGIQWRTAWSINGRRAIQQETIGDFLSILAKASGWPLTRYQTAALLIFSAALAVDLYFWELVLGAVNEYAQQTIVTVVSLLEQGWGL